MFIFDKIFDGLFDDLLIAKLFSLKEVDMIAGEQVAVSLMVHPTKPI